MKNLFVKSLVGFLCAMALTSCGGSSGDGGSTTASDLTISGTLGGASLMSQKVQSQSVSNDVNSQAVTLSDLEIYAIAFTTPPAIAQANVNADGTFSVNLPGAKGSAVTAVFRNKTTEAEVGVIKFVDSSKKDMNGNDSSSSSIVLSDSVSLGSITLAADGTVSVPVSNISSAIGSSDTVSVSTAFDPTGTWSIAAYDGTLPTGYQTATTSPNQGPMVGEVISLIRLAGKEFSPATGKCTVTNGSLSGGCAATDGTVGSSDRYALSIWGKNYTNGIGACGGNIGFTADEARAFGRISIENSGVPQTLGAVNLAAYTFSTSVTGFGGDASPFNELWMRTGAKASHNFDDCRPVVINSSYKGWACRSEVKTGSWSSPTSTGTYAWNVGVDGSGCVDSTTLKPVNITNWANIGNGTCGTPTSASSTYGTGFNTQTCEYSSKDHDGDSSTAPISFKCTYTGGTFTDSSGSPSTTPYTYNAGEFMGKPETVIAANANCSSAGSANPAQKLAAYRCYAEAFWNGSAPSGGCLREYQFDWQAIDPAKFVMSDYRGKPKNSFITNILQYSTDGKMATLEDENTEKITVPTGNGSSSFCEISRRTNISFKSVSSSKLLVDLRESGRMASTDAACVAAANAAMTNAAGSDSHVKEMLKGQKMMFYVNKQ